MAAIERGNERLLLFPWAGGGSLREYWDDTPHTLPTASTIKELLVQLKGLASALRQLHYFGLEEGIHNQTDPDEQQGDGTKDVTEEYSAGTSIRHGDLKPENLLWFTEDDGRRLTIADMGLAKRHSFATQERPKPTTTNSATILYEAPEAKTSLGKKARSRQYDIWSMGCILTEWIIWILYGNTELKRFYNHIRGPSADPHKWVPYYEIAPSDEGARATLGPDVRRWLSHIKNTHPECQKDTAINAIMKLIEDKLLIAELSPRRGTLLSNSGGFQGAPLSAQGGTRKHRPFCTRLKDENGHDIESFKRAIPYKDVPQTFRDAIETTRRLGIRYLWIDSLCIIQGGGGDFNTEAKRMEDVFSCAYCVIAASRASNPHDGFLGDRPQREFIAMPQEESSSVFLCEAIDDFGRHVLDGALNQRGWVLQERALARRTIYFTEAQAYFECGKGVRCETLAKMQNSMAEFLGDARFPDKAMKENSRAIKIRYFQDLYRRYSQLEFSHVQDRPIAIAGLENRLRKAYWTQGAYGIFDDRPGHGLFHRSLLWQRSEDEVALKLIDFSSKPESAAPTWSWMAHEGGIDYLDPPFQQMEWEETEIEPPWTAAGSGESHSTHNLRVVARPFNVAGHMPGEVRFVYDDPGRERGSGEHRAMCVVVAKERGDKP
ncbi:Cyclin-dependent kinase 2, partial [Colletotrichum shisoi]